MSLRHFDCPSQPQLYQMNIVYVMLFINFLLTNRVNRIFVGLAYKVGPENITYPIAANKY